MHLGVEFVVGAQPVGEVEEELAAEGLVAVHVTHVLNPPQPGPPGGDDAWDTWRWKGGGKCVESDAFRP